MVSSLLMPKTNLDVYHLAFDYYGEALPTEEGFTFDGTYLDEAFTESVNAEPHADEVVVDGMTWYFKWIVNET